MTTQLRVLVVAALAALTITTPAAGHTTPRRSLQAIRVAAVTYHVSEQLLRRRATCESRLNPHAINPSSGATGLFQFLRSTWLTTPYAELSPLDPYANALAAAWMVSVGRGSEWECR